MSGNPAQSLASRAAAPKVTPPPPKPADPKLGALPSWVKDISTRGIKLGSYVMLLGKTGMGKSSLAGQWPSPIFLCDPTDIGAFHLRERGGIPASVPIQMFNSYTELMMTVRKLCIRDEHPFKTVVIEGIYGLYMMAVPAASERCEQSNTKFSAYGAGYGEIARVEWSDLNSMITRLVNAGLNVVLTGHTEDKSRPNNSGMDYTVERCNITQNLFVTLARGAEAVICLQSVPSLVAPNGDILKTKAKITELNHKIVVGPIPGMEAAKNAWCTREQQIDAGLSPAESFRNLQKLGLRV